MPADVVKAVATSSGELTCTNHLPGGLIEGARRLQRLIAAADLVVFHIHNMDIVPLLAIAGLENRPRSLLVNHGDHHFWVGASVVDLVVSSRRSGQRLCIERRGVEPKRNALLPLCLKPRPRVRSQAEAKRALGLPADSVLVITIARAVKFRDIGGENFVEVMLPVLRANPDVHMIVVGPGAVASWDDSIASAPQRVRVLEETEDTQIYLDAADLYLDSFPFVSITSLLEAGLHGLPLVTRSAFGPDCGVMASDSPGLDGALVHTFSVEELREVMLRLCADPAARVRLGEATRAGIMSHVGDGWRRELARLYESAAALDTNRGGLTPSGPLSDLDCFIPFVFDDVTLGPSPSPAAREAWVSELVLKGAPLSWRLRTLARLVRRGELRSSPVRALLPGWIGPRLRRGFRPGRS